MEQGVSKRRYIKFKRRGITRKKAQNKRKRILRYFCSWQVLLLFHSTKNCHFLIISENENEGKVPVHVTKTHGRGEGAVIQLHSFLTSAIVGGKCVNITPRPLYPRERTPRPLNTRLNRKHSREQMLKTEKKTWSGLSYAKLFLAAACSSVSLSLSLSLCQFSS